MIKVEDLQNYSAAQFAGAVASAAQMGSNAQAIVTVVGDYTKRSLEDGRAMVSELATATSLQRAMEVQGAYARIAYDQFIAGSQKIGGLYVDLAKQACMPIKV